MSLQLVMSTGDGADAVTRGNLKRLATKVANEYMRINPEVLLHLRFLSDQELVESARARTRLGAGPDLFITRVATAETLDREGLLKPVAIPPQRLDPLHLQFLSSFQEGGVTRALPFLLQPKVACYDRRRVAEAPTTLAELMGAARRGVRVGLPLIMSDLVWTASGFDADGPLLALFRTRAGALRWRGLAPEERARVEAWLTWLYRANLEPTVTYLDTMDDLVQRLERGQLDWINCNSTAIHRLKQKLGPHLGVSVLPGGRTGQPARPLLRVQLLSFGRDSSPAQQRAATNFALFVLNDVSQTDLTTKAFGNLPANRNVVLPVKEIPALAAMRTSLDHSSIPSFTEGVGLRHAMVPLRQLLKKCVYGEATPGAVARGMEQVGHGFFHQHPLTGVGRAADASAGEP